MVSRLALLGIAIAVAGLIALPETLALFSGGHNFYDVLSNNIYDQNGTKTTAIPCEKCHADISVELRRGGANEPHSNESCDECHMTVALSAEGLKNGENGTFHAAASPACLDCHGYNATTENATGAGNAMNIMNGSYEVHKQFAAGSLNSALLKDANEACISCHTHVAVDINWKKAAMINFTALGTIDGGWTVGNFTIGGSTLINTYGNQTGQVNSSY
ncbi:MAG: hypothetical protein O8C62_10525 [Candidatus Methanoperedens sp.]|nr:hypothetical protein [Candidatus Methanoperedens sp.]